MRIIKSREFRHCKKCTADITKGARYWPQRNGSAICESCARKPKIKTFIDWLLEKLK